MNYFLHLWISRICSRFVAQKTKYQPRWSRWACLESVIFGRFIIVWLKTGDHMLMVYRCFNVSHIFSPLKVQVLRVPHIFAQIQIPHVVVHIPVYPIYVLFKSQSLVDFLSSLCHYINSYSPPVDPMLGLFAVFNDMDPQGSNNITIFADLISPFNVKMFSESNAEKCPAMSQTWSPRIGCHHRIGHHPFSEAANRHRHDSGPGGCFFCVSTWRTKLQSPWFKGDLTNTHCDL